MSTREAFPSSHHREEGWPSDQENIAQHPLCARPGWWSDRRPRNTTPSASIRRLRAIYLMTPPPLLAVMRGGECPVQNDTSKPTSCVAGCALAKEGTTNPPT